MALPLLAIPPAPIVDKMVGSVLRCSENTVPSGIVIHISRKVKRTRVKTQGLTSGKTILPKMPNQFAPSI